MEVEEASIPGEVVSILAEEGMVEAAETLVAAVTTVVAVVTLVVAEVILLVAVVNMATAGGAVTTAISVVAMAPAAAAMVEIELNMPREVDSAMLDGATLAMAAGVVTRATVLVVLEQIASLYRGNQVDRQVLVLMAIGTTLGMEEISKDGAQGGVAPWSIGIGVRTWRVLFEEALMPISCSKLFRQWWRLLRQLRRLMMFR
jgi:hypothetical protein